MHGERPYGTVKGLMACVGGPYTGRGKNHTASRRALRYGERPYGTLNWALRHG